MVIARADALGVTRMLRLGAGIAVAACGLVAASAHAVGYLAAHALVGLSFALLLSAGFAGLAAVPEDRRASATGVVAGANALAWIVVNPIAAGLTEWLSWRAAHAVPAAIGLAALLTARHVAPAPGRIAKASLSAPLQIAQPGAG